MQFDVSSATGAVIYMLDDLVTLHIPVGTSLH
jgi:hypothetical protein